MAYQNTEMAAGSSKRVIKEWNTHKRWNPFNSYKLLAHVDRWGKILRGRPIPAPVLITVDPTNICNFNCAWCNADYVRKHRNFRLSRSTLLNLADFLPKWSSAVGMPDYPLEAICIAGGGEPLLNPHTGEFIDQVTSNGIEVGIVSNGSCMYEYMDSLARCTWVGVSVDAGTSSTFNNLKGLKSEKNTFDTVIENIAILADYSRRHKTQLGKDHPSYGISYKYLLYPDNIGEVYEASKLAKEIGCKNIHFRPAGTPWDKLGTDEEIVFKEEDVKLFQEQISKAQELDSDDFNVFGITHKFNHQFGRSNCFNMCYSLFMTAVIMPPSNKKSPKDCFVMGLCCDRRGDKKLELLTDCEDVEEIAHHWGSKSHWKIHDSIDIQKECPRCTYQPHNQVYEQVILNDSMTHKFI